MSDDKLSECLAHIITLQALLEEASPVVSRHRMEAEASGFEYDAEKWDSWRWALGKARFITDKLTKEKT